MEKIGTLFGDRFKQPPQKKKRETERGEFLEYFLQNVNRERIAEKRTPFTIKYIAFRLARIPTKDLYYLKTMCEDRKPGYPFGKCFFGSLKPRNELST